MPTEPIPVLIVGAGPTGLNLANFLALYDIPFRIIEQKQQPSQTSNALIVQSRSLEMWDSMGLAESAIAQGKKIAGLVISNATQRLSTLRFTDAELQTQFPFVLGLSQADTENLLTTALEKQGHAIERGVDLINLVENNQIVTATVQHVDGTQEMINCQWLIATDGSHSIIRKKLNLSFVGAVIPEKFIMADVTMKADLNPDYLHAFSSALGALAFVPMQDSTRIICSVTHDAGIKDFLQPTVEDFNYVLKQRCPIPIKLENFIWISHFMSHHRIINNFKHGQILFAGDSAHIHSPVGGQGMNTGMQDSFNLAWKLALVIKQKSNITLLNSYNNERYPLAKKILSSTTVMTYVVTTSNSLLIFIRDHLIKFLFKQKFFYSRMIAGITELSVAYINSAIVLNHSSNHSKIKAGQRALPLTLKLSTSMKHSLLLFSGKNHSSARTQEITQLYKWVQANQSDFFELVVISMSQDYFDMPIYLDSTGKMHDDYDVATGGMFAIRPDMYVGLSAGEVNSKILDEYIKKIM